MTFQALHTQLIREISHRVALGDTTVSSFARRAGISQPHLHLVLQGKRGFSWDFADRAVVVLGLRVEDLVAKATPAPASPKRPRGKQPSSVGRSVPS